MIELTMPQPKTLKLRAERARLVRDGWARLREKYPHASQTTMCETLANWIEAKTGTPITAEGVRYIAKREGLYQSKHGKEGA